MQNEQITPDQPGSDDKAARRAVTVFPVLVLAAGAAGLLAPGTFAGWGGSVPYLLGVVMFCMGLTMTPLDFKGVAQRPWAVAIGLVAHYVIMPGLGWVIAHALGLPPQLAAGVILVGCAPSGTASNVVTFLARGDVALSVSVATVSTVLAPLITPPLTLLLAGTYLPVDAGSMVEDILKTVLLPVVGGLVVRLVAGRAVDRILGFMPWLSSLAIAAIVCAVVAGSAGTIKSAAFTVLVAVVLHNGLGLALGYGAGKLTRLGGPASRAMAFEVGMQNSGLAASLATAHFSPLAALPAAVFSVWHNISGALVAAWMAHRARREDQACAARAAGGPAAGAAGAGQP
ncbi:bile acid:sodium symporter family protein [Streptomyces nitrosporeus]|uniref:Bile acid:sodium symporter family protein n=1 Tax=Streptomyces nitrosporeus TaxID=28894 RepID=A0A5J6FKY8_9ACTN|nr:bile acid:sodium symporter family protein [Streptomyces nitrosporeus]QEU75964.1 bile acid:sodium symporter family protein [Streptomyces nitrosporeus]GGY89806.1 transporter [Streptomyces nitrosporeus]